MLCPLRTQGGWARNLMRQGSIWDWEDYTSKVMQNWAHTSCSMQQNTRDLSRMVCLLQPPLGLCWGDKSGQFCNFRNETKDSHGWRLGRLEDFGETHLERQQTIHQLPILIASMTSSEMQWNAILEMAITKLWKTKRRPPKNSYQPRICTQQLDVILFVQQILLRLEHWLETSKSGNCTQQKLCPKDQEI